eukprot:SM000031S11625  [mRNA]  locus=s31:742853:743393:- [translate_table: standard]
MHDEEARPARCARARKRWRDSLPPPGWSAAQLESAQRNAPSLQVTPSRRGKRNGPKALRPVPLIIKCTCCGRVKLRHQYCCTGASQPSKN